MEPTRWRRLEELFFGALERPAGEREAYLERASGNEPDLRAEVAAMLEAHAQAGGETGALLPADDAGADARIGSRLGAYRLEALIGRGGMGEVYRAVRTDAQYEQQVAIKVVRAGHATPEAARRFRMERQILAMLQHPRIATLLDGGVTPAGEPFLVMQYVEGEPITAHAERARLTVEQRLRLFIEVANAVQFAHANLIVHRDLKPSNILVTPGGEPRLLDFGIAKLLLPESAATTLDATRLLTPEHAAPEQFEGRPVTTATDVYALGVLLYELLAGRRPFQDVPPVDLPRAVCDTDPPPPSAHAPAGAARAIRGDLDQIVIKAMRREPERRYVSAAQLAEDVARHLDGQPVLARPDVLAYRVRKFVARNRVAVTAAAVVLATLLAAVILTARESRRRAAALRVANAERAAATRLADFLMGVFTASDPSEARGRTVTARELLDRGAASVKGDLASEPSVRADFELAIGRAYQSLGLGSQAAPLIDEVVRFRRGESPGDPLKLADAVEWEGRSLFARGQPHDGVARVQEALALRERALGPDDPVVGRTLTLLTNYFQFLDFEDTSGLGERSARRALEIFRAARPVPHRDVAQALRALGSVQVDKHQVSEGLASFQASVAEARQVVAEDDPMMFNLQENLAIAYMASGQPDSAIAIHRRLLAARERVFGKDHPDYAFSLYNLARTLSRAGQHEEALALFQRALDVRERVLGPEHYLVGWTLNSYAIAAAQAGDLPMSARLFERATRILPVALGPTHLTVQDAWEGLAIVRTLLGRHDAAIDALEAAARAGYDRRGRLEQPPFSRLAGEPRFRALLARMGRPA